MIVVSGPRRLVVRLVSLVVAAAIWLPAVHLWFDPGPGHYRAEAGVAPGARAMAVHQLELWSEPELLRRSLARMRQSNAEWDFMGRTFLVLALGNMALREPARAGRYLTLMDRIIDATLRVERERGMYVFLMGYARQGRFVQRPARSVFVDGEIALMLGARRLVADSPRHRRLHRRRVQLITRRFEDPRVLCVESYPDECWTFCNTIALAAVRIGDALDGTDHSALIARWLATARERLTDPRTGMLASSYTTRGRVGDGPEGSSIWLAAHCLQLLDPALARHQYRLARLHLGRSVLGFGYAREWPEGTDAFVDVDSGPIVPGLGASPGSSGLALVAAAAFGDRPFFRQLTTTLELAAFPVEGAGGGRRFAASNQVGDAVMLYAMVLGPAWERTRALLAARPRADGGPDRDCGAGRGGQEHRS